MANGKLLYIYIQVILYASNVTKILYTLVPVHTYMHYNVYGRLYIHYVNSIFCKMYRKLYKSKKC